LIIHRLKTLLPPISKFGLLAIIGEITSQIKQLNFAISDIVP